MKAYRHLFDMKIYNGKNGDRHATSRETAVFTVDRRWWLLNKALRQAHISLYSLVRIQYLSCG